MFFLHLMITYSKDIVSEDILVSGMAISVNRLHRVYFRQLNLVAATSSSALNTKEPFPPRNE